MAYGTERTPFVIGVHGLCRIFHYEQVSCGYIHDFVHVACHAGIVHGHDDSCPVCYERFNFVSVDIGVVFAGVGKNYPCSLTNESKCR